MLLISTERVARKEQHSHAHSLLGEGLRAFGVGYVDGVTPVIFGEHGKPSLAEHPGLRYNISHADGIMAVVISEFECGIDCEPVRAYRPNVMKRVFGEAEREAVNSAPEAERDLMFFRLWTLKEAYVKALGAGLTFPLREAEFALEGDKILTKLSGCTFTQYVINNEFTVSVCEISDSNAPHMSFKLQTSDTHIVI